MDTLTQNKTEDVLSVSCVHFSVIGVSSEIETENNLLPFVAGQKTLVLGAGMANRGIHLFHRFSVWMISYPKGMSPRWKMLRLLTLRAKWIWREFWIVAGKVIRAILMLCI